MSPDDARSTVRASGSIAHEKPTRGAKLFLSTLKLDDSGLAANGRESGDLEEVVADPEQDLEALADLEVVLDEERRRSCES